MKIIQIPKKTRGEFRTIYVPDFKLKTELRSLLSDLENNLKSFERNGKINGDVLHGFVSERSPVTNAKMHIGFSFTLSMDLSDFFDSVKKHHVKGLIPDEIIEKVFYDGSPRQGLPTSPLVCNIAAIKMDIAILRFIKKKNLKVIYTRYADDLSFSFNDRGYFLILKNQIKNIVCKNGFKLNDAKTRLQSSSYGNREVTGVMVGESGITVSRKFKRKMRAAKHKGNLDSYEGMSEWTKLKKPKTLQEKESNQDEVYNILRKNGRAKPSYFKTRKLKEIRDGRFLITNDLAYVWGMTDLADGWTSCYKRSGCNKNAPIFLSYLDVSVGLVLSNDVTDYFGVKRNKVKGRCIIYTTRGGEKFAHGFYGSAKEDDFILFLKENGIKLSTLELSGDKAVSGYGINFKCKSKLYVGKKVLVKLKDKRGQWAKVVL